jgi:hypothetical protein
MGNVAALVGQLDCFPPLVTTEGMMTAREYLKRRGVDIDGIVERYGGKAGGPPLELLAVPTKAPSAPKK